MPVTSPPVPPSADAGAVAAVAAVAATEEVVFTVPTERETDGVVRREEDGFTRPRQEGGVARPRGVRRDGHCVVRVARCGCGGFAGGAVGADACADAAVAAVAAAEEVVFTVPAEGQIDGVERREDDVVCRSRQDDGITRDRIRSGWSAGCPRFPLLFRHSSYPTRRCRRRRTRSRRSRFRHPRRRED